MRDTLAWALFANGLHDEAIAESEKALELTDDDSREEHQGHLDRLRKLVQQARASGELREAGDKGDRQAY